MQHMKETYNFTPSKRAYQTQFRRWGFPSKQNPAHKNEQLVARVKELWEVNTSHRKMLEILHSEGHHIKERELTRVRSKNRLLLRIGNGGVLERHMNELNNDNKQEGETDELSALQQGILDAATDYEDTNLDSSAQPQHDKVVAPVIDLERSERLKRLYEESDELFANKKRRRRTRGWGGMGPDPVGPPRFPSELTLAEAQSSLQLSDDQYREVRKIFDDICEENNCFKKTIVGPEKWTQFKNTLVAASPHLQSRFWNSANDPATREQKSLSLDVICSDVTKRRRVATKIVSIADYKNVLGINPEEGRELREVFYDILKAKSFTTKLEFGAENWENAKQQLVSTTPRLTELFSMGEADPEHDKKRQALEMVCRDVMKRLRDTRNKDQNGTTRKIPNHQTQRRASSMQAPLTVGSHSQTQSTTVRGPFPEGKIITPNRPPPRPPASSTNVRVSPGTQLLASRALSTSRAHNAPISTSYDPLEIDPSLLAAAAGNSTLPNYASFLDLPSPPPAPVAIYIRPNPNSEIHHQDKVWLGMLEGHILTELRRLIAGKWPHARVSKIEGIEKAPSTGEEIRYLVEEDDELDAYLNHVQGRKATFVVMLMKL